MKIGVYVGSLGANAPMIGGGYTFRHDILQSLVRLDSRHSFVVFSDMTEEQIRALPSKTVTFVSLGPNLPQSVTAKLAEVTPRAFTKLRTVIGRSRAAYTPWLQQTVRNLGIHLMWYVGFDYSEASIPYIYAPLDLQHRVQPWFPEVGAERLWHAREGLYATVLPRAWIILVGTEVGKTEVVQFYHVPQERVKVIPFPTPTFALRCSSSSSRQSLAKYHIPENYLLYPSQFWAPKNHVGLLLAVSILIKVYGLSIPVVFVGSDKGNIRYVRQVVDDLALTELVHFLGFVPREELVELYRSAFALTFLTYFGPDNLPPLEAFALGCPVIASNVPGSEEQLGDAALLVDPNSEQQIADAIKLLYDDHALRANLVARGKERASKWTAEDYIKSVLSLIDEIEPIRRRWGH